MPLLYVQKHKLSDPISPSAKDAVHGFQLRGYYSVSEFTLEDVRAGVYDEVLREEPECVFFGGVGTIREILKRAGKPAPPVLDLPESLRAYWKRKVWKGTMGEVRAIVQNYSPESLPIHMKPLNFHKLFTGRLVREFKDLIPSAHVDATEPVLLQEPVELLSEWRAYVLRGEIINVGFYTGDPLLFPNSWTMKEGLRDFTEKPVACAMDWGVLKNGETALIEVNDGFSLGNYSLRSYDYAAMIEARWRELMGLPEL